MLIKIIITGVIVIILISCDKLSTTTNCFLTKQHLKQIMPNAKNVDIDKYFEPLIDTMKKYEINTLLRMAHFFAQIGHESGSLKYSRELGNTNYFKKYDRRKDLGNTKPGDGARFKGRGLIQLTGYSNYKKYGKYIGIDLTKKQGILERAKLATDVAGWYWNIRRLNALADKDDVYAITRKINGGYNGLRDRQKRLERAKKVKFCN